MKWANQPCSSTDFYIKNKIMECGFYLFGRFTESAPFWGYKIFEALPLSSQLSFVCSISNVKDSCF